MIGWPGLVSRVGVLGSRWWGPCGGGKLFSTTDIRRHRRGHKHYWPSFSHSFHSDAPIFFFCRDFEVSNTWLMSLKVAALWIIENCVVAVCLPGCTCSHTHTPARAEAGKAGKIKHFWSEGRHCQTTPVRSEVKFDGVFRLIMECASSWYGRQVSSNDMTQAQRLAAFRPALKPLSLILVRFEVVLGPPSSLLLSTKELWQTI